LAAWVRFPLRRRGYGRDFLRGNATDQRHANEQDKTPQMPDGMKNEAHESGISHRPAS
jgi:hypothetical protein